MGSSPAGCTLRERIDFSEIDERVLVPSLFRPWASDHLARVRLAQEDRVLEVACGSGIVAWLAESNLERLRKITGPRRLATSRVAPVSGTRWRQP